MSAAFFRHLAAGLVFAVVSVSAFAQEYKYEIGGMGGGAFYMGDVNKSTPLKGMNPSLGLVFRYNANFRIAFKGGLTWARVTGSTADLGGQFEFNFFPYSDKFAYLNTQRLAPYLLVGLGGTVATGQGRTFGGLNLPIGVGIKYKLRNRVNIGAELTVHKVLGDGLDNAQLDNPYNIIPGSVMKNGDWYTLTTLFLTWDFGPRNRKCNSTKGIEALMGLSKH